MKTETVTCDRCGSEIDKHPHQLPRGDKRFDLCDPCYGEHSQFSMSNHNLADQIEKNWLHGWEHVGPNWPPMTAVSTSFDHPDGNEIFVAQMIVSKFKIQDCFYIGRYRFVKMPNNGYEIFVDQDALVGRIEWTKSSMNDQPPGWNEAFAWDNNEPGVIKWNGAGQLSQNILDTICCLIQSLERKRIENMER